mmetsp:Transcript_11949/g.34640  ORF Transcript_11949/g.34640 Transcript_11949/m.34640 type:complete len:247 (+) Transcript_11949:630-1370(+)
MDRLHHTCDFYCGAASVGVFEINNGLIAAKPGSALVWYLLERIGLAWVEWGKEDVDPKHQTFHILNQKGAFSLEMLHSLGVVPREMMGLAGVGGADTRQPTPAEQVAMSMGADLGGGAGAGRKPNEPFAPFIATTGPGFFTRGIMRYFRDRFNPPPALPSASGPSSSSESSSAAAASAPSPAPIDYSEKCVVFPPRFFFPTPNTQHRDQHMQPGERHYGECSLAVHHWRRTWRAPTPGQQGGPTPH